VNVVQLRDRSLGTEEMTELVRGLRTSLPRSVLVLVNGDIQAAVQGGADGVHLPEGAARTVASRTMLCSRAVHSLEAAVRAERDGADLLVLGTVFASTSHPGEPTIGLDGVRAICGAVRLPVVGIGGITAENAGGVIGAGAGASGVAVITAILDALDPHAAAAALRSAVDDAWRER